MVKIDSRDVYKLLLTTTRPETQNEPIQLWGNTAVGIGATVNIFTYAPQTPPPKVVFVRWGASAANVNITFWWLMNNYQKFEWGVSNSLVADLLFFESPLLLTPNQTLTLVCNNATAAGINIPYHLWGWDYDEKI